MKCPRCGFFDPYWLKMAYDREGEYCKPSDLEDKELLSLKRGEILERNGFMYKRSKTYLHRLPIEIFHARGDKFSMNGKGYWDAINISRAGSYRQRFGPNHDIREYREKEGHSRV